MLKFVSLLISFYLTSPAFTQSFVVNKQIPVADTAVTVWPDTTNAAKILLSDVNNNVGKMATVCGKIYSTKLLKNVVGKPTLMNLGNKANERIEVRIRFDDLLKLESNPEKLFLNKQLCITGLITNEHGFTEIALSNADKRKLIQQATDIPAEPREKGVFIRQPLITNAYLFAGAALSQPIITHLKTGSIVVPQYLNGAWAYVHVVDKAGANTQPTALFGFIRASALNLKKRQAKVAVVKL